MGKRWIETEDKFLRDNYGSSSPADIAAQIGRPADSVVWRAGLLGLRKPRNPAWSDEENRFLRNSYPTMPIGQICEHLERSYVAVQQQAQRIGAGKAGNPGSAWTEDEDALLRDLYGVMPATEVARYLGRTETAVAHRAMNLRIRKRRRRDPAPGLRTDTVLTMRRDSVRHDYFAQVDSPVKAYLLGWLASDGNVGDALNAIRLRLNAKDEEILHLFRQELAPLHRVNRYEGRRPSGKMSQMSRFQVSSERMKQDLIGLGVTPNKSLTLQYPPIAPELDRSFILGHFDGDGSLFRTGRSWRWTITCGSGLFLIAVQDRLEGALGIRPRGPYPKGGSNRAFQITLNGAKVFPVDAWLHADLPGLRRKQLPPDVRARAAQDVAARAEKLERARQLRTQGLTLDEIAAETGFSRSFVHSKTRAEYSATLGRAAS
jgi:hypothetical protein